MVLESQEETSMGKPSPTPSHQRFRSATNSFYITNRLYQNQKGKLDV